jgi:hypothetical protein
MTTPPEEPRPILSLDDGPDELEPLVERFLTNKRIMEKLKAENEEINEMLMPMVGEDRYRAWDPMLQKYVTVNPVYTDDWDEYDPVAIYRLLPTETIKKFAAWQPKYKVQPERLKMLVRSGEVTQEQYDAIRVPKTRKPHVAIKDDSTTPPEAHDD